MIMRALNLLLLIALLLAACSRAAPAPRIPTATLPAPIAPPPWTITPSQKATFGPSIVPKPTHTIGPAATPATSIVYTATDALFTLKIPSNWTAQSGQRELITRNAQQMNYVVLSAPGTAPQPAILIFYKWPAAGPIDSDTAWEQAYAIASLGIKVCPMTLTTGGAIMLDGEPGKYIGYADGCGVQGELIGFTHNAVNYGVLIEAPQVLWERWRPILRDIIGTLTLK